MRRFAVFGLLALLPSITGNAPALARAGSLDPSFGSMGRVTTSFPAGAAWGNALAIQADGKIVVAGSVDGTFALARFKPDGSLDGSFGSSGLVTTSFAEGDAAGNALAIQANGLIVAAGSAGGKFALARYTIDGSLDGSFGSSGQLTTWFAGGRAWANAVTIQTDGKIVAAGGDGRKFALARYDADGALDNRFGGDGTVRTDFGPQAKDYVIGATLQADGKIVAAGKSGYQWFALARYRTDGSLDPSFGDRGRMRTSFGPGVRASADDVVVQADRKIVVAGWAGNDFVSFALARYRPNGTLDPSFGGDGRVRTGFGRSAEAAEGVAIQSDGKIVAVGMASYYRTFALARYLMDGSLDASFGNGGKVKTTFSGDAWGSAVAIQTDGRILAIGTVGEVAGNGITSGAFALARYRAS
jgi:uncharacterized delta-60 repeat protein